MKDHTFATALFIVIGFLCVGLVLTTVVPIVRTYITNVGTAKPTVPTSMQVAPTNYEKNITITLPTQAA